MPKKLQLETQETHYRVELDSSEYDFFEVVQALEGKITVKFNEGRWRSVEETIDVFEEMLAILKDWKNNK